MKQFISQNNKKGISMVELIAYVALMGSVMAVLMSTTSLIAKGSAKIQARNKLNIATTQIYSEFLSSTTNLTPDNVSLVYTNEDSTKPVIGVEIWKKYDFLLINEDDDDVDKEQVETDTNPACANSINRKRFIYNDGDSSITVMTQTPTQRAKNEWTTSTIDANEVDITSTSFEIIKANTDNSYIRISGECSFSSKLSQSFSFVIPVFTSTLELE